MQFCFLLLELEQQLWVRAGLEGFFCTHIGAWTSFWVPARILGFLSQGIPLCAPHCHGCPPLQKRVLALRPVLSNLIITHCVLLSLQKVGIVLRKAKHSLFSFNTACHSSLLNKCSGNAFPIATFLILMGFGNRSGFSLWSFTINLRQV